MVPQAWFVIGIFIVSVLFAIVMTAFSPYYRALMFNNNTNQMAYFFITTVITAILMLYSAQCSVVGSKDMPMCDVFSWVLVGILGVSLVMQICYGIYAHVAINNNIVKASSYSPNPSIAGM